MGKKETKWDNSIIEYAREYGWKVYHIETWKPEGGAVIRRFAFKRKGSPTIKVMFADDKVVTASQWYYGRRLNENRPMVKVATMRKWLRSESWTVSNKPL